ncbi:hypothetical protein B0181_01645 [Moraxella caviae]|uniref:Pseudouridine synthase n=1 Tax=Moraxella caviae TaxID=34060 RepID=A0A1T0A9Q9_9GAMM|nr:pseudouridine synthase [Moraxella caviae]OOR92467.1 hypothetical protein B0181_01645 [Moraxella caviae]STZ13827.1 Ribosomal large subunit pseudouridine synthase E [Moraxella caviae]
MPTLILFNKPYGVHSQFRKDSTEMRTLADYFSNPDLRVAGRLDKDSEGLLLLTDHGGLNHAITAPKTARTAKTMGKTYLVQVENTPTPAQITQLSQGVVLKDGKTLPAVVRVLGDDELPIALWQREPPIRERKSIPTAWLVMTIFEGKNRQVRRMTASVGLPCLRLIRMQIGEWSLVSQVLGQAAEQATKQVEQTQLGVGEYRSITLSQADLVRLGVSGAPDDKKSTPTRQPKPRTAGHAQPTHTFKSKSHPQKRFSTHRQGGKNGGAKR